MNYAGVAIAFVSVLTLSGSAIAAPPRAASTLTILTDSEHAAVRVSLDCRNAPETGRCQATIVAHATDDSERLELFIGGPGTSAIQTIEGKLSGEILSGAKAEERFCGAMMGDCPIANTAGLIGVQTVKNRLQISIAFKYTAQVEADRAPIAQRHPIITGETHAYLEEGPVELVIQAPSIEVALEAATGSTAPGLSELPTECRGAPCRMLMGIRRDVPFRPGGLLFGLGAMLRSEDDVGFLARFGYEFAAPAWLHFGLQLDTDFYQFVGLGLTMDVACGDWLHGTVGVGGAFDMHPVVQAGIRTTASVGLGLVSLVLGLDIFPGAECRGLLLLQAGL